MCIFIQKIMWHKPFSQMFSNVNISWRTIVLTKDPSCDFRKPFHWCHCDMSQVMIKRSITRCQHSINHNITFFCQRDIWTWKQSCSFKDYFKYLIYSETLFSTKWSNLENHWVFATEQWIVYLWQLVGYLPYIFWLNTFMIIVGVNSSFFWTNTSSPTDTSSAKLKEYSLLIFLEYTRYSIK